MDFLKIIWSSAVWCVCVAGPFYVLYKYGPYWALGAGVITNFVWIMIGDVGVGTTQKIERVGHTAIPRKLVFYASLAVIGMALYRLALHLNLFIIRH